MRGIVSILQIEIKSFYLLCIEHPFIDDATGWSDWVDEYYYIYPDGIAIRHFIIHGETDEDEYVRQWTAEALKAIDPTDERVILVFKKMHAREKNEK